MFPIHSHGTCIAQQPYFGASHVQNERVDPNFFSQHMMRQDLNIIHAKFYTKNIVIKEAHF